jgi:TFIIF-interacting CTD phosphatase-like protein
MRTNKCIVLDLDETLVHSHPESHIELLRELKIYSKAEYIDLRERIYKITMDDVVDKKGTGVKTEMWGILRPHVKEFLEFCFKYFKIVIVWSAGMKNYVNVIVDFLFKDIKRPLIIWDRNEIEKLPDGTLIKPLNKLINTVPGLNKYMSLENTFIVDDRITVFAEPNPHNGIEIIPYKPEFNLEGIREEDTTLLKLIQWFSRPEVMNSRDVRELDKTKIFY